MGPWCWSAATHAARSVRASAARPVAVHKFALGQAGAQVKPEAGPHRDAERFPQMRRGVGGPARPQVQLHDPGQQEHLVPQVARTRSAGAVRRRGVVVREGSG